MAARHHEHAGDEPGHGPPGAGSPRRTFVHRIWPAVRILLGIGILVVAVWAVSSHWAELSGLTSVLAHLNWWWVPPAVIAEAASFVCFAGLQYEFLRSGGLEAPRWPLVSMTTATQAITNSLPGGNAVGAVYTFRWFRRFGADDTLAAWVLVGTMVASVVTLSLVAMAGLGLAAGEGASLDLVPVLVGVFVITVGVAVLFVYQRPLYIVVTWSLHAAHRLTGRPGGDMVASINRIVEWVTAVRLGSRQITAIVLWGTANWLFDCACFAMMFLAVDAPIPWKGLLLAYGAGQLAAMLPVTPGGLGVVEGSITIALVAFGGAHLTTVDAVLLYRVISFWLVLGVGWALCGQLALQVRRGRWRRAALETPVAAGPVLESTPGSAAPTGGRATAEVGR